MTKIYKKFKDIPQFPFASYRVNMPWGHLENWLEKEAEYFDLDLNPPYQRGHVWDMEQKIAYIEYILMGGFSGKDIFWNAPQWMGMKGKDSKLEIVDGKQRFQAVLDFMNNKVKAFGTLFSEYDDKLSFHECDFIFHVNNLQNQEQIVRWYLGMNTGGSVHTEKDLKPAYDYLKSLK